MRSRDGERANGGERPGGRILLLATAAGSLCACNLIFDIHGGEPKETGSGGAGASSSASAHGGGGASTASGTGTGATGGGGAASSSSAGGGPPICDGTGPLGEDGTKLVNAARAGGENDAHGVGMLFKSDGTTVVAGNFADQNTSFGVNSLAYPTPDGSYEGEDIYVARFDSYDRHKVWAYGFGGPQDQKPTSIAIDPSRNILIAGFLQGSLTFPPTTLNADVTRGASSADAFLAKLDENGAPQWAVGIGGPEYEVATSVAVHGGEVVVAGTTYGGAVAGGATMHFGAGCDPVTWPENKFGVFVARYTDQGDCMWANVFPVATGFYGLSELGFPVHVAVDHDGGVFLAGGVKPAADNSLGGQVLTGAGGVDAFLAKFEYDGTPLWSFSFGDANDQHVTALGVDACGNIVVAGSFTDSMTFEPGQVINGSGGPHAFLAKYQQSALAHALPALLWKRGFVDSGAQEIKALAVNASSDVAIAGNLIDDALSSGVDFGDGQHLKGMTPDGGAYLSDAFVAKLDGGGALRWAQRIGGAGAETARGVALDDIGHTGYTGDFEGTYNFGLGSWTTVATDAYFVKLGP